MATITTSGTTAEGPTGRSEADGLAAWLCERLAAALGYNSVNAGDDFFELGGDSVAATALVTAIADRFRVELPISVIVSYPTMAALARYLTDQPPLALYPPVLPVETAGERTPLFVVHGLTGQAFAARYLRDRIGPRRPIYGLQAAPQRPSENAIKSVPELAADYIAAIRSIQPTGPYLIASYCAGVLIAWEMAQTLIAAGETVPLMIAIDPPSHIGDWIGGEVDHSGESGLLGDDKNFRRQTRDSIVIGTTNHEDMAWLRRDPDAIEGAVETAVALRAAFLAHRPQPYTGRIALICSAQALSYLRKAQRNPDQRRAGWPALMRGKVDFVALRGSHTGLFKKQNPAVPDAVRQVLESAGF
ncbi:MAG: thioesterase domain-containing protein [Dongiaceae bacterium]